MNEDTKKKILEMHNEKGISMQNIARILNISVEEVLIATGNQDMLTVRAMGDQIDDAGPGATIQGPVTFKVPYTKD